METQQHDAPRLMIHVLTEPGQFYRSRRPVDNVRGLVGNSSAPRSVSQDVGEAGGFAVMLLFDGLRLQIRVAVHLVQQAEHMFDCRLHSASEERAQWSIPH